MNYRNIIKKKEMELDRLSMPLDIATQEKVYSFTEDTFEKLSNDNGNSFTDTTNIFSIIKNINKNHEEIQINNSYIQDAVDMYENNPENIDQNKVKELEDNMRFSNILNKNIQLALLSREDATNIENFNNNLNETLTKTALVLDNNKHLCINTFQNVKDIFNKTNFSEYIDKLLELRDEIYDKDIKYITCIDHLLEAISDTIKPDSDIEKELYHILDHHSYLFGQLLGPNIKAKQAYMTKTKLSEDKIKELCRLFKEYIDISKSYKNSKIFTFSSSYDYISIYNNIFGSIEKYSNSIRTILNSINSIGELSYYRGLSQEEKIERDNTLINNTIIKFLSNFKLTTDFKISEEVDQNTTLTNVYFKNGLLAITDNEYKVINFDNVVKDNILKINNDVLNGICDNLINVKNVNSNFINGFIDNVLTYLKTNLPTTDDSYNLVTVNLVLKILTDLIYIYKEDIIYKFICVPNMIYNHTLIYKQLVECLEGSQESEEGDLNEDKETDID